jgi:hypothetical protein
MDRILKKMDPRLFVASLPAAVLRGASEKDSFRQYPYLKIQGSIHNHKQKNKKVTC